MRHRPSPNIPKYAGALVVAGFFLFGLAFSSAPGPERAPAARDERSPAVSGAERTSPPFGISEDCRRFIATLPEDMKYGWVTVPESPSNPSPVHVFYYHRPRPGEIPTVIYNGGPRASSHNIYSHFESGLNKGPFAMWNVFLDQRGNGCSSPYPSTRPHPSDFAAWGTKGIVEDSEAVRKVLGITRWNLVGQSYGAFIVYRYVQDHPEAIGIAVAHGAGVLEEPDKVLRLRFRQQAFVIGKFIERYPTALESARKILHDRLCADEKMESCGGDFVSTVARQYLGFTYAWSELRRRLKEVADRGFSKPLRATAGEAEFLSNVWWLTTPEAGYLKSGDCQAARTDVLRRTGDPAAFAFSECWSRLQDAGTTDEEYRRLLSEGGIERLHPAAVRAGLEKNPELRLYMFAGELDYVTPPAQVSLSAAEIGPRASYAKIEGAGHESYFADAVLRVVNGKLDEHLRAQGR